MNIKNSSGPTRFFLCSCGFPIGLIWGFQKCEGENVNIVVLHREIVDCIAMDYTKVNDLGLLPST